MNGRGDYNTLQAPDTTLLQTPPPPHRRPPCLPRADGSERAGDDLRRRGRRLPVAPGSVDGKPCVVYAMG